MYKREDQRSLFDLSKKLLTGTTIPSEAAANEEINDLRKVIVYHEWKYYVQNDPVISDFEYDSLYKRLEALEEAYPNLITQDSPTQRVSNDLTETFSSVEHLVPMLSLANSYNEEDLNDFDTQIKKLTLLDENVDIEYCVEPKFDGGSIALVFENDQLVRGATRGNGTLGEEMTNNARVMKSIPLKAAFSDKGIHKAVLVERAGDVIPYIVKPMEELRDGSEQVIEFPKQCPVCSITLARAESEAAWRCPNYNCDAQGIWKRQSIKQSLIPSIDYYIA